MRGHLLLRQSIFHSQLISIVQILGYAQVCLPILFIGQTYRLHRPHPPNYGLDLSRGGRT